MTDDLTYWSSRINDCERFIAATLQPSCCPDAAADGDGTSSVDAFGAVIATSNAAVDFTAVVVQFTVA